MLNAAAQSLLARLFASDCRLCNAPVATISRLPVCDLCLARIEPIHSEICGICGERLPGARFTGEYVCGDCRREQPLFARATAYGSYEGGLRDLIHLFKYEQVRPAGWVLGRMLGEVIQELAAEFDTAVVVPVPLHKARLRQRQFNQAEEIARHALQSMRCDRLEVAGVLKRRRATQSQTGLTLPQRRENVRGAFVVQHPEKIAARTVVLVDDVFTTGATVSECAGVLRRAGAEKVFVATVARVLKPEATWAREEHEMEVAAAAHA